MLRVVKAFWWWFVMAILALCSGCGIERDSWSPPNTADDGRPATALVSENSAR